MRRVRLLQAVCAVIMPVQEGINPLEIRTIEINFMNEPAGSDTDLQCAILLESSHDAGSLGCIQVASGIDQG